MARYLSTYLLLFTVFLTGSGAGYAQFNILESFRTSEVNDLIVMGGKDDESKGAVLTAAEGLDPPNEGWLRLTNDEGNQRGFAFINKSFPSTLGVQVELEYKMYRSGSEPGADGFTIFLFDGEVGEEEFRIGGYGGSLGYNRGNGEGLHGAYLGIGFDVYGNFTQEDGLLKNRVVIRGSERTDYRQIAKAQTPEAMDIKERTSRPSDDVFYRKVQVRIEPTPDNRYHVWVGWKTKKTDASYTKLLEATINEKPFETLKLGFAASTGGSVNYHEIRDVVATTPGNLRVASRALQEEIVLSGENYDVRNEFQFAIDVYNETKADLNHIEVNHAFKDLDTLLESDRFELTDISTSGFLRESLPTLEEIKNSASLKGIVGLTGGSQGTIILSGKLLRPIKGERLISEASVATNEIEDVDLENNFSTANSIVNVEGVDLAIRFEEPDYCLEEVNTTQLVISNIGNTRADYTYNNNNSHDSGEIMLQFRVYPPDSTLIINETSDWKEITHQGGLYQYVLAKDIGGKNDLHIAPESELEPFVFTFDGAGLDNVKIEAQVIYEHNRWPIKEVDLSNNLADIEITRQAPPLVEMAGVDQELVYCWGEEAATIEAIPTTGNQIIWYDAMGTRLSGPPKPDTQVGGTTIYYVTQSNGYCESPPTEIKVIVLDPEPGKIQPPNDLCLGTMPFIQGSNELPGIPGALAHYQWQVSFDGETWHDIAGAEEADFQSTSGLQEPTYYRRWTLYSYKEKECRSPEATTIHLEPETCTIMVNPALPVYTTP